MQPTASAPPGHVTLAPLLDQVNEQTLSLILTKLENLILEETAYFKINLLKLHFW